MSEGRDRSSRDLTKRPERALNPRMSLPPFQSLLDAYAVDVHRFLIASVGRDAADDCYQETWVSALRSYPRLRHAENLRGWLLTIAHRKAVDHGRSRQRAAWPAAELPEIASADLTTEALDNSVWPAVAGLPAKQRQAVALRYALDADYATVASTMGTTAEAARRNVHEGLKRLRKEYDRD
jgi:RNA polymerase sigma factor (sigma-70 family)